MVVGLMYQGMKEAEGNFARRTKKYRERIVLDR